MDRLLRRELDAIARDRRSGAAELAQRAVRALQTWLRHHSKASEGELLEIAHALLRAQPSMAPLLRVANEVALSVDAPNPRRTLRHRLSQLGERARSAPVEIANHFAHWIKKYPGQKVFTYSYSSTVVTALTRAKPYLHSVGCSESRPGNEGVATASKLSQAGLKVFFTTDAGLFCQLRREPIVVLGADAIVPGWIAGKVGIKVLSRRAISLAGTVVFLADTMKFWPETAGRALRWDGTFGPDDELWKEAPARVEVYNLYFEVIPLSPRLRVLTERGWMTPKQVRRELKKIRISPRLAALAD